MFEDQVNKMNCTSQLKWCVGVNFVYIDIGILTEQKRFVR